VGFTACWSALRRIEGYARQCALKLLDIEMAADHTQSAVEQSQVILSNIEEYVERRFPIHHETIDDSSF
jgi:hypothetical protein